MITGGKPNAEFKGTVIYKAAMNTNGTQLQAAVDELVKYYPNASVIGIVGNYESGNELEFQYN